MTAKSFEVRPIASALGAEVFGLDLSEPLSAADLAALHATWIRHGVLAVRDQPISPEQFLAFVRQFGEVEEYPYATTVEGLPEVTELLKLPEDAIAFGRGWHMDMSYRARPPMGTFLHGKEVPDVGGDTCFASLTYAWLMLSECMRTMLADLIAVHESWPPDASLYGGMGLKNLDKPREVARHPLAGSHPESNDPVLFVSPYYAREIEGMTPEESQAMFDFLNGHATRNELTCRVRWEPDTIVMWDNRSTIHEALDDDLEAKLHGKGYRRRMHRAVVRDPRPAA